MNEHLHPPRGTRYLGIALGITISFFIIELVGGIITNSLTLLTDAWHMLNDVLALGFALVAAWLALRPISTKRTYGYYRIEILAAFFNGVLLWVVVVILFYRAIQRILQSAPVDSLIMLIIAVFGLIANGLAAVTFTVKRRKSKRQRRFSPRRCRHLWIDWNDLRWACHVFHRMVPGRPLNQHVHRSVNLL